MMFASPLGNLLIGIGVALIAISLLIMPRQRKRR